MNIITVNNVTKRYGKTIALKDVSATFEPGKIYGLLGRNGAGKSTLLKIMTNRAFANDGNIFVNGENCTENSKLRENIAFMTEQHFYGTLKVSKIIKSTADLNPKFDSEKAYRYCEMFTLNTKKKFQALSTGYKNIFKLIVTLCHDLPYLVFDEPVVGLDAYHRELFYKLMLECYEDGTRTIILATHLIEEVQSLIEDVIIIDDGEVLLADSVENILSGGFSVAGTPAAVDEYIKHKNVVDTEEISGMKIAYLVEKNSNDVPQELTLAPLSLQKIFVKLTGDKIEQQIS